jgi:hypothetical protein
MITNEILQRIHSLYSKGVQSDDSRLSDRHIYNKVLTVRSKLISQEAKKTQKVNQWNYQTLPCVELIKAPIHECPCLPPIGCQILKSKYPIPKPLTDLNIHLFQSVTNLDGTIIYSEISWENKKYKKGNKYTAFKADFFIKSGHLYITCKSEPKVITITGLFQNPLEAFSYPSFCNEDCVDCQDCESPLDKEFPIDNDMLDTLIDICKVELLEQFSKFPEDKTNNSVDSSIEQSK